MRTWLEVPMPATLKIFRPSRRTRDAVMPGAELLGLRSRTPNEVEGELQRGLPLDAITRFRDALGIPEVEFAHLLDFSIATLHRRKSAKQRLKPDESGRLFRLARLLSRALMVLGNLVEARTWLHEPLLAIGNRTPLEAARTELGAELVLQVLGRLEDGVYS